MVDVDVHHQAHDFPPRLQHVIWYRLSYIPIKLKPLVLLKYIVVYLCVSRIKRQRRVVVFPKVQENIEDVGA